MKCKIRILLFITQVISISALLTLSLQAKEAILPPFLEESASLTLDSKLFQIKRIVASRLRFCYQGDKSFAECGATRQTVFATTFETKDEYSPEGDYPVIFYYVRGFDPQLKLGGSDNRLVYVTYHSGANGQFMEVFRIVKNGTTEEMVKLTPKAIFSNADDFEIHNDEQISTRFISFEKGKSVTIEQVFKLKNGEFIKDSERMLTGNSH